MKILLFLQHLKATLHQSMKKKKRHKQSIDTMKRETGFLDERRRN